MKPVFVSFQGVHPDGRSWGMVRIMEPVVNSLPDPIPYFVSHTPKYHKSFIRVSFAHHFISWLVWAIGTRLRINVGLLRYLQERSFDLFLSKKLKLPCILVSTAIIPTSARMNSEAGGLNIFVAGNPYDGYISRILESESIKYSVKIDNAYTFPPRLDFIDRFVSAQHELVSQSVVTHESFFDKFPSVKKTLVPYELLPSPNLFPDIAIPKHETFTFLYLASSVWLKGLTYLVDAWNILGKTNSRLVIAGPIYPDVMQAIKEKLPSSVECIGFVPSPNLNFLYRESHVCIVPSLADDHPATIAEAMFCGLPVITTQGCGGRSLISDGKTGFVVPIADAETLAHRIRWFLDHPHQADEMGRSARATIASIDSASQSLRLAALLQNRFSYKRTKSANLASW